MDDYGMPDEWLDRDLDDRPRRPPARRVRPTPGHTQGHYVFADEDASLLFAGDHVLSTITPSIGFEPAYVQQPLRDYLSSLAKVRALPDLKLLPAHGPVTDVLARPHRRAGRAPRRTAGAVAGGGRVRRADGVGGRRRAAVDPARAPPRRAGPFDGVLAAFETLAHLELLALQGKLARVDGETVRFTPLEAAPPAG